MTENYAVGLNSNNWKTQMGNIADEFDYALMQKETLSRLRDEILLSNINNKEHLLNLTDTAIDYGFYLSDERQEHER